MSVLPNLLRSNQFQRSRSSAVHQSTQNQGLTSAWVYNPTSSNRWPLLTIRRTNVIKLNARKTQISYMTPPCGELS